MLVLMVLSMFGDFARFGPRERPGQKIAAVYLDMVNE